MESNSLHPHSKNKVNKNATISLYLGVATILLQIVEELLLLTALPGIVFGAIALKQIIIRKEKGIEMAIAGIVFSIIPPVIMIILVSQLYRF